MAKKDKKKKKVDWKKKAKDAVLQKCSTENVFCVLSKGKLQDQFVKTGYYFWDEAGMIGGGPYATEKLAKQMLDDYAKTLDEERNDSEKKEKYTQNINPMEVQKPLPTLIDLLAWYLHDRMDDGFLSPGNTPPEIKEELNKFFKKSPLQLQIYLETNYEDFYKEFATVYSEVNKKEESNAGK